jgi:hypothetical protein
LQLALLLLALILFARTLAALTGLVGLALALLVLLMLARLARLLTLLVRLSRALSLAMLVGTLVRVLLATLFVRHWEFSFTGIAPCDSPPPNNRLQVSVFR